MIASVTTRLIDASHVISDQISSSSSSGIGNDGDATVIAPVDTDRHKYDPWGGRVDQLDKPGRWIGAPIAISRGPSRRRRFASFEYPYVHMTQTAEICIEPAQCGRWILTIGNICDRCQDKFPERA